MFIADKLAKATIDKMLTEVIPDFLWLSSIPDFLWLSSIRRVVGLLMEFSQNDTNGRFILIGANYGTKRVSFSSTFIPFLSCWRLSSLGDVRARVELHLRLTFTAVPSTSTIIYSSTYLDICPFLLSDNSEGIFLFVVPSSKAIRTSTTLREPGTRIWSTYRT